MTMLKFNFGLYGDRYESGFLTDLAETGGYYRFNWDDINMDERVQSNEISSPRLYETFFEGDPDVLFDPDMVSAKTLELTLGIDHELFEDVGVGATLIYRKVTDLFWERSMVYDENGNLRPIEVTDWVEGGTIPEEWGGYTWWEWQSGLEDSGLNYTDNAPDFYTRYWGLELSFQKRFSSKSRWLLNGSITLQDWRDSIRPELHTAQTREGAVRLLYPRIQPIMNLWICSAGILPIMFQAVVQVGKVA